LERVETGLDRFLKTESDYAGLKAGARLGLVAHPASIDGEARHVVDLLTTLPLFRLTRLFAPEHGVSGEAQDMEPVKEGTDRRSGLPIRSLYGSSPDSLRPSPADLEDLDAVICDLQDVGSRYYTFVYTVSHVMEAARDAGIPVVVLDRPNPINGTKVEGPVLEPALASFVGRYPIPVRHGMTIGEMARLFNGEFGIGCDLRVVPMAGWRRDMHFEDTGLPWVAPSPNMPTMGTAVVYPGACLVEGTNLSEGRGTTRPFELIGAPWIDGPGLADAVTRESMPGVLFRPTSFRPAFQKHAGNACHGLQVHVTDRDSFLPFGTYLIVLREAVRLAGRDFDWRREPYEFESERLAIDLLLGRAGLREMIEGLASLEEMEASWGADLRSFSGLRRRFTIYPD
jgi:uncharacterized protein YbbC (DUF1343 family)